MPKQDRDRYPKNTRDFCPTHKFKSNSAFY